MTPIDRLEEALLSLGRAVRIQGLRLLAWLGLEPHD